MIWRDLFKGKREELLDFLFPTDPGSVG